MEKFVFALKASSILILFEPSLLADGRRARAAPGSAGEGMDGEPVDIMSRMRGPDADIRGPTGMCFLFLFSVVM